ncbi:MAG TPA: ribosome-associated translation inhibitor RaiA [Actinomycetota bacterium]
MDLVLKGRGVRITDQIRRAAEHKVGKLSRVDPRVSRVEVEVTKEPNPRIDGGHRVEVACTTPRRVFRAEATGEDVASALDQVIRRLERQITSYRGKRRDRRQARGLESLS